MTLAFSFRGPLPPALGHLPQLASGENTSSRVRFREQGPHCAKNWYRENPAGRASWRGDAGIGNERQPESSINSGNGANRNSSPALRKKQFLSKRNSLSKKKKPSPTRPPKIPAVGPRRPGKSTLFQTIWTGRGRAKNKSSGDEPALLRPTASTARSSWARARVSSSGLRAHRSDDKDFITVPPRFFARAPRSRFDESAGYRHGRPDARTENWRDPIENCSAAWRVLATAPFPAAVFQQAMDSDRRNWICPRRVFKNVRRDAETCFLPISG